MNINKSCPNKYRSIKKLNSEITTKEQKMPSEFINNYALDQDESIINSNLNEFAKMIQEMKSSYSISFNISLFDSLNLYIDGKKSKIMEKEFSSANLKKIIEDCSKKVLEDNKLNEIINFCENFDDSHKTHLDYLYGFLKSTADKLEEIAQFLDIKTLLIKHEISQPLNPTKEINKIQLSNYNRPEEKFCLILVFSFFYAVSNIKALNEIKDIFEKINLKEIKKINIIKENIIAKYMKNTDELDENALSDIWNKVRSCNKFIDDKIMNEHIIKYVREKNKDDFKNDLFNLLKPFVRNINL